MGSLSIWHSPFKPILVGSSDPKVCEVEITIPIKFGESHIWLVVDLPL